EINTPMVVDRKLWEASGHWEKYRENMFTTEIDDEHANEKPGIGMPGVSSITCTIF
ncbi:MAG: hypothetical protein JKY00_09845, partial [Roseicyclus sp.]|nr:hypothetical protein [Roseicyclus sp.]